MMNDFREIAPTFVLFAPRIWDRSPPTCAPA